MSLNIKSSESISSSWQLLHRNWNSFLDPNLEVWLFNHPHDHLSGPSPTLFASSVSICGSTSNEIWRFEPRVLTLVGVALLTAKGHLIFIRSLALIDIVMNWSPSSFTPVTAWKAPSTISIDKRLSRGRYSTKYVISIYWETSEDAMRDWATRTKWSIQRRTKTRYAWILTLFFSPDRLDRKKTNWLYPQSTSCHLMII